MTEPDREYFDMLARLVRGEGDTAELTEELHSRYIELFAGGVTGRGYPYPSPTDPIAQGADAIRALAEAIGSADMPWTAVAPNSGWSTGSGTTAFAVMRRDALVFTRGTLYGGTGNAATVPTWARPLRNTTVPLPGQSGAVATITIVPTGVITFPGMTAGLSSGQISWMVL